MTLKWVATCKEYGIPSPPSFSLREALGDPIQIRAWGLAGLPNDSFSVDNGIMVANARRWPLMIDPQNQVQELKQIRNCKHSELSLECPSEIRSPEVAGRACSHLDWFVHQANKWVKNMEKDHDLKVIRLNDPNYLRSLENAIQFGIPVLLENVGEALEPSLEPLLLKQIFKSGGAYCIRLGDATIEYSDQFRY